MLIFLHDTGDLQERGENLKELARPESLYTIWTKGLGFLELINCWKVNMWGKLMEDKGHLVRFVGTDSSQHQLPVSSDKNGTGRAPFSWEIYAFCF